MVHVTPVHATKKNSTETKIVDLGKSGKDGRILLSG
jgi:hypothetical protein